MKFVDLTGKRFGRLLVLNRSENSKPGSILWNCLCDCGNKKEIRGNSLSMGRVRSCKCLFREVVKKVHIKHGMSHKDSRKLLEYGVWLNMRSRCNNPNTNTYHHYGGRGIKVCDRWNSFENFLSDMGKRPPGMTIDRIDNNGPYSPENCRWATWKEQSKNKRPNRTPGNRRFISGFGKTQCIAEWSRELGIPWKVLDRKIKQAFPWRIASETHPTTP